jgi:hypothetical protein
MIQRQKPFSQQDIKRKKMFQAGFKTQDFPSDATDNASPKRRTPPPPRLQRERLRDSNCKSLRTSEVEVIF